MTLDEQQNFFMVYLKELLGESTTIQGRISRAFTDWFQALVEVPEAPAVSTKESGKAGGGGGAAGAPPPADAGAGGEA